MFFCNNVFECTCSITVSAAEQPKPLEESRGTPLPPIGISPETSELSFKVPDVPFVFVMGKLHLNMLVVNLIFYSLFYIIVDKYILLLEQMPSLSGYR